MKIHAVPRIAAESVAANPSRPATALVNDSADARLVVFRLEAGQVVAPHTSTSSVVLVVSEGSGFVSDGGGEQAVRAGDVVTYEAREPHGMRATAERLVLLAVIAPRPGGR